MKISLDNVRKSYEQDENLDHLESLLNTIHKHLMGPEIPEWNDAKDHVYVNLFPNDDELGKFIGKPVTEGFRIWYVYYDGDSYCWITISQIEEWGISLDAFLQQVDYNMCILTDECDVKIKNIDGHKLAFIETEFENLKASILLSKNFRDKISPVIGWPVC